VGELGADEAILRRPSPTGEREADDESGVSGRAKSMGDEGGLSSRVSGVVLSMSLRR